MSRPFGGPAPRNRIAAVRTQFPLSVTQRLEALKALSRAYYRRFAEAVRPLRRMYAEFPHGREPQAGESAAEHSLRALAGGRGVLWGLGVFSALINLLYLSGSLYMLQIYDRVLPSRSIPTLVALSILVVMLYAAQAALDFCRSRILIRLARSFEERLSPRVFTIIARLRLVRGAGAEPQQPLRDLDRIRSFLASGGPTGFFDLPWLPFYLAICFLFHPLIALAAFVGAGLLAALALGTGLLTRDALAATAGHSAARSSIAEATRRNAEVLAAMGMVAPVGAMWDEVNRRHLEAHQRASDVAIGLGNLSKVGRMVLQSTIMGIGAWLVIEGEASAGIIIAGSILSARALAPIEQVITHWNSFTAARLSWNRLRQLFTSFAEQPAPLPLRKPCKILAVENVAVAAPASQRAILQNVSFTVKSGCVLGIIGPSGSGKSSLARVLVGAWRPPRGSVRLDGASLDQWSAEALGSYVGYLPQDNELFDGTIEQNIARFQANATPEAIISAAEQAGVHALIVGLPDGYATCIGEEGMALSGGQRQRIALARALYNDPFLVVLDEPNSNLDAEGEQALMRAVAGVKRRGGIVVLIAHRANALAVVDDVLVLAGGQVQAFGPRDQVLRPVRQVVSAPPPAVAAQTAVGASS